MGFVESVCQPSTFRMLICPDASSAQNNIAAVSAEAREGEQAVSCLLQAVGNSAVLEPPFADEGLAADLYLLGCRRVDHVVVIRGDLVMQALGCMREKISVLVNRAALHRHAVPDSGDGLVEPRRAVDNEELGPPQPAPKGIVEDSAPRLGALAAHALDREQPLLAVRAHAEDNEQRDRGRLAVEPHANDGAVENQAHDRILDGRSEEHTSELQS